MSEHTKAFATFPGQYGPITIDVFQIVAVESERDAPEHAEIYVAGLSGPIAVSYPREDDEDLATAHESVMATIAQVGTMAG